MTDTGSEQRSLFRRWPAGVSIVVADVDGHRHGRTVSSLVSLSLDPPLVLWCLARDAASLPAFRDSTHFGVNVLSAGQHHVSRLFATAGADKFGGVESRDGPSGVPLLDGVLARFVCRNVRHLDAGDHVIVIGEVEHYETFPGEPLVFHSGAYQVTTRHPEL